MKSKGKKANKKMAGSFKQCATCGSPRACKKAGRCLKKAA
jgi:hypothetical protein